MSTDAPARREAFWRPRTGLAPLAIAEAQGGWVETVDGTRFYEGASGLLNLTIGHADPTVLEAAGQQLERCAYAHPGIFEWPGREQLATQLLEYLELTDYCVLFVGSGTDAIECASLLARQFHAERGDPQRTAVITRQMSYHGASEACLARSGHLRRREIYTFLPALPEVPAPYCFRCPMGTGPLECDSDCLGPLVAQIERIGPDRVAAILVEPVGGAAGAGILPVAGYYPRLRAICDRYGILLIADEVMCGMGRTGNAVALRGVGALPDILVVGKGLGAGYADISAVVVRESIRGTIEAGSRMTPLTHTYGGNPLAVSIALAVVRVLRRDGVLENVRRNGPVLLDALRQLQRRTPCLLDTRGCGFMLAVELAPLPASAGGSATVAALALAREHGLLLYPCNGFAAGGTGDALLIAPPLNASEADLAFVIDAVCASLTRLDDLYPQPA